MVLSHQTTHILAHASFKVGRADEHIAQLKQLCEHYFSQLEHTSTVFVDEKGVNGLRVSFPETQMIVGIPLCIGDAVHNLRAALDHTFNEILLRLVPDYKDTDRTSFPFDVTETNLRNKVSNLVSKEGLPRDVADIITEKIKPWKEGHAPFSASYALWALSKLDNMDKHKFLTPVVVVSKVSGLTGYFENSSGERTGDFEDNTVILSEGRGIFFIGSVDKNVLTNAGTAEFNIVFPSDQHFDGQPVIPILENLVHLVQRVRRTFKEHLQTRDANL